MKNHSPSLSYVPKCTAVFKTNRIRVENDPGRILLRLQEHQKHLREFGLPELSRKAFLSWGPHLSTADQK